MKQLPLFDVLTGRRVHPHSREALQRTSGERLTRYQAIVEEIKRGGPGTDREIMCRLGLTDMNQVRPRITEGIWQHKELKEVGKVEDRMTGLQVRVVNVVQAC